MPKALIKLRHADVVSRLEGQGRFVLNRYVNIDESEPIVDWNALSDRCRHSISKGRGVPQDVCMVLDYLRIKGKLAYEGARRSFYPTDEQGRDISPNDGQSRYPFLWLEDAMAWARVHSADGCVRVAQNA